MRIIVIIVLIILGITVFVRIDRWAAQRVGDDFLVDQTNIVTIADDTEIDWNAIGAQGCRTMYGLYFYRHQVCFYASTAGSSTSKWETKIYYHRPRPYSGPIKARHYFTETIFGLIIGHIKYDGTKKFKNYKF